MKLPRKLYTTLCTATAVTLAVFGLVLVAGAGPAKAEITGSVHDFSTATDWNPTGEICRVCHVPHDHALATQYYTAGLLWNRELSTATYTLYDSTWSDTLDGATGQPDGIAKLCLGCHDGTVGLNQFGSAGGTAPDLHFIQDWAGADRQIPAFDLGGNRDLRGTHPVSIEYNNAADLGLHDPALRPMGGSGLVIADVLDNGKVQCSSCHDVHNNTEDLEAAAGTQLLRVGNTAGTGSPSGLCLTCHKK